MRLGISTAVLNTEYCPPPIHRRTPCDLPYGRPSCSTVISRHERSNILSGRDGGLLLGLQRRRNCMHAVEGATAGEAWRSSSIATMNCSLSFFFSSTFATLPVQTRNSNLRLSKLLTAYLFHYISALHVSSLFLTITTISNS